jgi:hypothetical protein
MTIKVKIRENKAIVRYNNPMEESFFIHIVRSARDNGQPHPKISLKGKDGQVIPPIRKDPPVVVPGKPIVKTKPAPTPKVH